MILFIAFPYKWSWRMKKKNYFLFSIFYFLFFSKNYFLFSMMGSLFSMPTVTAVIMQYLIIDMILEMNETHNQFCNHDNINHKFNNYVSIVNDIITHVKYLHRLSQCFKFNENKNNHYYKNIYVYLVGIVSLESWNCIDFNNNKYNWW